MPTDAGESGWVTTDIAAAVLGVSPRTVRRYIERGALVGRSEVRGITKTWLVSRDSLRVLREQRAYGGHVRRESPGASAPADSTADMANKPTAELQAMATEVAEMRARLELAEQAEATLRRECERLQTKLEQERERHQADVRRERGKLLEAQEHAERLLQALQAQRRQARQSAEEETTRLRQENRRLREELEAERDKRFFFRRLFER